MTPAARTSGRRDLAVLVTASFVSVGGDTAALIALTLRLHAHGGSGWSIAALLLAGSAPMVLLSPLAGAVADRIDSRTAIAGSALAQAGCAFALAHVEGLVATYVLVALLTAAGTLVGPSVGALVPRIVAPDRLVGANALLQGAFVGGNLTGPIVGGLLTGALGSRAPLELDAISFLVVAAGIFMVRTRRRPRRDGVVVERRSGFRVAWDDRLLRTVIGTMTVLVLVVGAVNVAEVFLVKDALHATDTVYGIVSASWMLGMVAGAALTPRLGRATAALLRTMAGAQVLFSVALFAAGVSPVWPAAAAAFVIGGVGNGALSVACRTIVVQRVPDAVRGRVLGVMTGTINAASVAAFGAGGALVSVVGPRWTVGGCGIAAIGVATAFGVSMRRLDLDDDRDDHRPATVGVAHPLADDPPDELLELVDVGDTLLGGAGQGVLDERAGALEGGRVLGEAPGQDLRPGGDLAGDRVDHDEHRHEPLAAEDAPVLQRLFADVTDGEPVDVHVAGRHGANDASPTVDEVDDDTVLGDHHVGARHPTRNS
jgi:MFS family permease